MLDWVVHSLGSVDLVFVDAATSSYFVEDVANPPEQKVGDQYVPLNDGAGARLASFTIGEAPHTLDIICLGTSQDDADSKRDLLQDQIDAALNGSVVVYSYQVDPSMAEPVSWRVIGGVVRPRWRTSANEQIFGLSGKYVSLAKLIMNLSKT